MNHAICYISTASSDFPYPEVDKLLAKWQAYNSSQNIKGILLFSGGNFFQVLEGEKERVISLFHKIQKDSRHSGIIQVLGKDINKGSFDGYVVEHLQTSGYSKPELIEQYCETVKGMDPKTQQQIKIILESFIDTRVL